jgi:hypothetical protein
MKSRLSLVLAAITVAATPIAARATGPGSPPVSGPTSFTLLTVQPGAPIIDGGYVSPYNGAFTASINTTFYVWCVDLNHEAFLNTTYDVYVTPLAGLDFSHTRLGAADANLYRWASVLAGDMKVDWTSNPGNSKVEDTAIQDAMWTLLGEEGLDPLDYTNKLNNFASTYSDLGLGANFWDTTLDISSNDFALLTCAPTGNQTPQDSCGQEFLMELPSTGQSVTPEPATMSLMATGLVGMMGAGTLRRRRRKA